MSTVSAANTLSRNGKRYVTRGWRGARYVKRATSKRARRLAREAIRENDGESVKAVIRGWIW